MIFNYRAAVPMSASHSLHCDGKDTNYRIGSSESVNQFFNSKNLARRIVNGFIYFAERMAYEVFLGGSCNPTTWRSEIAIPTLQSLGITYYNPVSIPIIFFLLQ